VIADDVGVVGAVIGSWPGAILTSGGGRATIALTSLARRCVRAPRGDRPDLIALSSLRGTRRTKSLPGALE